MIHTGILRRSAALFIVLASTGQTAAGGYTKACYEEVRRPAVYKTVHEKVLVEPGREHVEIVPAIYGTQKRRVLASPARESWRIIPATYATMREKVLLEPARTVKRVIPAETRTVHRKVMVDQGGHAWEWRWIKGKKVLCKIKRGPTYKTVAETVVVTPARVVHESVPARYGYENRTVLTHAESRERIVTPPVFEFVTERVEIQPARKKVHRTPPRYDVVARQVLVEEGRTDWRRVKVHCRG